MPDCTPARCRCPWTHVEWQEQVVALAHALGYRHLHVRRTVGRGKQWTTSTNLKGWPDLLLFAPGRGFIGIELKVGVDKPTAEQTQVLAELEAAGARVMVAYPHHLAEVQSLLRCPTRVQ
jgi:hypothetical protein